MEILQGKRALFLDTAALAGKMAAFTGGIHIDIGTGDGRFVQHTARTDPARLVIGIDACRENLVQASRRAPENALFVIANARALPCDLFGLAAHITVNFPWGSLLGGLLADDAGPLAGLRAVARPEAALDIRLNGGALAEAGWALDEGAARIHEVLNAAGFAVKRPLALTPDDLKSYPSTWSKRIAFGRDPRAVVLRGTAK